MAPPENDPHHHVDEAAQYHPAAEPPQYQAAPAQYHAAPTQYHAAPAQEQAAHDDPHSGAADTHQTDTGEAKAPKNDTPDHAPAHTPDNPADTMSGPPSGWTHL